MPYYGTETQKSLENFPSSLGTTKMALVLGIVEIKRAAAKVHQQLNELDEDRCQAIILACDQILERKYDEEFVTSRFQGGAGTSINMNVNEVVAHRATEILKHKGKNLTVHPNDHVNKSQSTNDVNPSALRFVCYKMGMDVLDSAQALVDIFKKKSKTYAEVPKVGRTHLQDAVPTTVGAEFGAYAAAVDRARDALEKVMPILLDLNLGGTAIGNGINASKDYRKLIYAQLSADVDLKLQPAKNLMAATSDQTDFWVIASALARLMLVASKIASDFRILSSGPRAGIYEFRETELQAGSSIMPGKVNPIISELVNQAYYMVSANAHAIELAVHKAQLELGVMFPLIADRLLESHILTRETLDTFTKKSVAQLHVNPERCERLLEESFAYATLLTPSLGYDTVSASVKKALKAHVTLREVIVEKEQLMSNQEFDKIIKQAIS